MRRLTSFFCWLLTLNTLALPFNSLQQAYMPSNNLLDNPGFESGKASWTASGGTFTLDTSSNIGYGSTAGAWDASGAQTLCTNSYTIPAGWYGAVGKASLMYKGGDTNLSWQVRDGSSAVIMSHLMKAATNFEVDSAMFSIPTSGSLKFCIVASADAAAVYIDQVFMGYADRTTPLGTPEINLISNPNDAGNWAAGANMTVATSVTTSELPLGSSATSATQIIPTGIKITRASGTNSAYTRFTMPASLKGRKLKVQWEQKPLSGYAAGDLQVQIRSQASSDYSGAYTRLALSTDSSAVTSIPANTGRFATTFDADGTADYYELDITGVAGTTALVVSNVVVGPGIQPQGAVVSSPSTTTFTLTQGFGTSPTQNMYMVRSGSVAIFYGSITLGTSPSATQYILTMPTGMTIDTTVIGSGYNASATGNKFLPSKIVYNNGTNTYDGRAVTNGTSTTQISFLSAGQAGSLTNFWGGSSLPAAATAADKIHISMEIPIAEWASSGTVNLAQNDFEYAFNTSGLTTAATSNTTSFGYGPAGAAIGSIASQITADATTSMRVRFQTPITANSQLLLETDCGTAGAEWSPVNTNSIQPLIAQGPARFGAGWEIVNATDVDVYFGNGGRLSTNATYSNAGTSYAGIATWRWRLKKTQGGQAVGFGQVAQNTAGLVKSAGQLLGTNTNDVAASGYVGERIFSNVAVGSAIAMAASGSDKTVTSISLTAGQWLVSGVVYSANGGTTSWTNLECGTSLTNNTFGSGTRGAPSVTGEWWTFNNLPASSAPSTISLVLPPTTVQFASTTTVYFVAGATYTSSTPNMYGYIEAVRVR